MKNHYREAFDKIQRTLVKDKNRLQKTIKESLGNLNETVKFPDLMKIFNKEMDEMSHSKFLAWIMGETKGCKKGKNFLKEILLEIPSTKEKAEKLINKEIEIESEKQIIFRKKPDTDEYRRIDIHVEGSNLLLILENKIRADFSSKDQLGRYAEYVERNKQGRTPVKIFLYSKHFTPDISAKLQEAGKTGFTPLTYNDIARILRKIIELKNESYSNYLLYCYLSSLYRNIVHPTIIRKLDVPSKSELSYSELYEIEELKEGKLVSRKIDYVGYEYIRYLRELNKVAERLFSFLNELCIELPKETIDQEHWELKKQPKPQFDEWYYKRQLKDKSKYLGLYFGFYPNEKNKPQFYTAIYSNHENWNYDINKIIKSLKERRPQAVVYPEEPTTIYLDIIDIKKNDHKFFNKCLEKLKGIFDIIKADKYINSFIEDN